MRGGRILLVAEDRRRLPLVGFLLRLGGYEVTTVHHLDEARNWLQLTSPDRPCDLLVIDPAPGGCPEQTAAVLPSGTVLLIRRHDVGSRQERGTIWHTAHCLSCPPETLLEELDRLLGREGEGGSAAEANFV